jgi:hypothetical protein
MSDALPVKRVMSDESGVMRQEKRGRMVMGDE